MSRMGLGRAGLALALSVASSTAWSKDYQSGELETSHRYGFGAFEARIRAAKGPGVISTFFLWKPGSEQAPAIPWHEIDFEMGQASGDYQTQVMTPGLNPPLYRTEHPNAHTLPSRPWEAYYTYRIEWTPTYIAFFVDGQEVSRETDPVAFASMFATDSTGDTPVSERMEVRTGVWPGLPNIYSWSGTFDPAAIPTAHFVDYVKIWGYTPNQANKFATVLLDEQFDSLNFSNWYPANWTFEFSASDYTSQNIGAIDGRLVVAATTNAGAGLLPRPPPDVPPPPPPTPHVDDGFIIEAEKYDSFYDTTPANLGSNKCPTTSVDVEPVSDPTGGTCDVGWTEPGEWLQYNVQLPKADEYDVSFRLASPPELNSFCHLEVDGVDVSGAVYAPGNGWQTWSDVLVPGVFLSAGAHSIVLWFDTGGMNVNYLAFERVDTTPPNNCLMTCDDANPCTTDSCDALTGCKFVSNTAPCADDGNLCTDDVCAAGACLHVNNTSACADDGSSCTGDICSAGVCSHPTNGTCSTGSTPCSGLCGTPQVFTAANFSSGNLGTGAVCYQTTSNLNGGVCGNFASGRKLSVNGTVMSCTGNWPNPLPAKRDGGYCVQTTGGGFPWAYFVTW